MLLRSSRLLIIAVFTPAICAPGHNITITVPEGFSNHGNKHLFCEPTKWYHILLFFFVNYLSHAATVKARPGQSTAQSIIDFVSALFLPYSGLMRAVEMIAKSSKPGTSGLRKAANAGALCMVVGPPPEWLRKEWWEEEDRLRRGLEPDPPEHELEHNDRIPENQSLRNDLLPEPVSVEQHQGASDTPETHQVSDRDGRKGWKGLVGAVDLLLKILFYLSTTNPQARKIHGSCRLPAGYLLAPVPSDAVFDDQPGVKSTEIKITTTYNGIKAAAAVGQTIFASITLYQARGDQIQHYGYAAYGLTVLPFLIMSIMNLCVTIVSADYPTMYCVESKDSDEAVTRGGHIVGAVGRLAESTQPKPMKIKQENLIFSADRADSAWFRDDYHSTWQARIQRSDYKKWKSFSISKWPIVVSGFGSLPIIVIAALTHFDAAKSTRAQRAWLMTWLVFGCWFGPNMASRRPKYYREGFFWNKIYYLYMIPGIGGIVVVAQMILSYGWCTRFDDLTNS